MTIGLGGGRRAGGGALTAELRSAASLAEAVKAIMADPATFEARLAEIDARHDAAQAALRAVQAAEVERDERVQGRLAELDERELQFAERVASFDAWVHNAPVL